MRHARLPFLAAALGALFLPDARDAGAYVEAVYTLQQVMAESEIIVEGVIEKADNETKTGIIKTGKCLKGKCDYPLIRMNIGVGQIWHPEAIWPHLVPGAPVLVFYNQGRQSQTYLNRFFFQLYGDAGAPPDKAWWNFTHIEIRMNRTFYGTVPELSKLVADILAGKAKFPSPDPKMPPISKEQALALPPHPKPQDFASLPACFAKKVPDPKIYEKKTLRPDEEGFIKGWLVLGPVPLGEKAGDHQEASQKAFFDKEWYAGQKKANPRVFEKVKVTNIDYTWDPYETSDYYLDLGAAENSLNLCVAYLVCDKEAVDLTLLTGSDDSVMCRLNGKEVIRVYTGRGVGKDSDKSPPVSLKKGVNTLELAVINGGGPTGGCARFVDKEGKPFRSFTAAYSPTGPKP
jgi:hypothetical protein